MRLILIDSSSGFIFGDTANYLIGGLDEWRDNNSDNDGDIERLSLLAAELLDDCIGEHGREYGFVRYDPRDTCRFTLQCGTDASLHFNGIDETEVSFWAVHLRLLQAFLALKMRPVDRSIDRASNNATCCYQRNTERSNAISFETASPQNPT